MNLDVFLLEMYMYKYTCTVNVLYLGCKYLCGFDLYPLIQTFINAH